MWQRGSSKSDIFVEEHKRQNKWRPRRRGMNDIMAAGQNQRGRHGKQGCLHPLKCPFSLLLTLIGSAKIEEMSINVFPHQNLNSWSWLLWIIWIHCSKARVWGKLNTQIVFQNYSDKKISDRIVQQITPDSHAGGSEQHSKHSKRQFSAC